VIEEARNMPIATAKDELKSSANAEYSYDRCGPWAEGLV
jgi:hypothetical protein